VIKVNKKYVPPKVSLIVTSHNQIKYSKLMYASLKKYTHYPYELIWIDCVSTDGTREWLDSEIHKETVKVFVPKIGIGEAMNIGFSKCSTESKYIGDLDNDLILTEGWLKKLIKHMEMYEKIAALSTLRAIDLEERFVPKNINRLEEEIQAFSKKIGKRSGVQNLGVTTGSHTIFRRIAIEQMGLWDSRFWMGEDSDIAVRLVRAGWKCRYAADTWVYHFKSATVSEIDKIDLEWRKRRIESRLLFRKLYGARIFARARRAYIIVYKKLCRMKNSFKDKIITYEEVI